MCLAYFRIFKPDTKQSNKQNAHKLEKLFWWKLSLRIKIKISDSPDLYFSLFITFLPQILKNKDKI